MKQTTWRVGWYSKVVLTIIAVSLVGLLVRQLPRKVEAKPEWREPIVIVDMAEAHIKGLATELDILSENNELPPKVDEVIKAVKKGFNVEELRNVGMSRKSLLEWMLQHYYTIGYRIKFITGDFIILESE